MSWPAVGEVLRVNPDVIDPRTGETRKLTFGERSVYLYAGIRANPETGRFYAGMGTVARELSCSRRHAVFAVKLLRENELLVLAPDQRPGFPREYTFPVPKVDAKKGPKPKTTTNKSLYMDVSLTREQKIKYWGTYEDGNGDLVWSVPEDLLDEVLAWRLKDGRSIPEPEEEEEERELTEEEIEEMERRWEESPF